MTLTHAALARHNRDMNTTATAAAVLINATRTGLANGWSFDQAADMAIAAMIEQDADTMRRLIAAFEAK